MTKGKLDLNKLNELDGVMPENKQAMSKAATQKMPSNVSSDGVEETTPSDTSLMADYTLADTVLASEHLSLIGAYSPGAKQAINQLRQDLAGVADQVQTLRLPDTRVNIAHQKVEIPYEIKRYAHDLDQEQYLKVLHVLCGAERIDQLKKHSMKANQLTTPALWLNQQLVVETKMPYAFTLSREVEKRLPDAQFRSIPTDTQEAANKALVYILGEDLFRGLAHISNVNQLPIYLIFVMLVDEVLAKHVTAFFPVTAASIWEKVTTAEGAEA